MIKTWEQIYQDAKHGDFQAVQAIQKAVAGGNDNARPWLQKLDAQRIAARRGMH